MPMRRRGSLIGPMRLMQPMPPCEQPGVMLLNPPYGERLSTEAELIKLYSLFGVTLKTQFGGWRCGFFTDQEYRKYASRQKQSQYLDHSDAVQAGRPIRHMGDHRLQKDGQHTAHRDDRPDGRIGVVFFQQQEN